jgi:hypothetical protein
MAVRLTILIAAAIVAQVTSATAVEPLDYEYFKSRVQPLFLQKRAGHTRCYVCHVESNNAFRLERLPAGGTFWAEEQSRRNFEVALSLVVPGNPSASRLLLQPLAPEEGGNAFHSGGRQFSSKDDPDWKVLEQWVAGQKN